MPRARQQGGTRAGTPGAAYPNRTDLNPGPLPAQAAPGQTYGEAGGQLAAQAAVPMGTPGLPTAPPSGVAAGGAGGPGGLGPAGPPPTPPGHPSLLLGRPTDRPNEPVTAGQPTGPGVGSDALNMPGQQQDTLVSVLSQMSSVPGASGAAAQALAFAQGGRA